MALTRYHGYDCGKDPLHTFTPADLASMREYDMIVNCLYKGHNADRLSKDEVARGCAMVLRGMSARRALAIIRMQRNQSEAVTVL